MHASSTDGGRPRRTARRALLSFVAFVCGVTTGAVLLLALALATGEGSGDWPRFMGTSFSVVGVFAAPVWLLAMLPLSLATPLDAPILQRWRAPGFGALCGALGTFLELAFLDPWIIGMAWPFLGVGAVVGGVAWGGFAALMVRREGVVQTG
jgi:hypothetical protein